MVMIPVYMVPLSILLHITSLVKLRREQPRVQTSRKRPPRQLDYGAGKPGPRILNGCGAVLYLG
jgi:hypothetical protein